jgi:mRNA-degrading endonuclease RelE of RelBE toxin-antitoxin system
MILIETSVFTRRALAILSDEEYRRLQLLLVNNPEAGDLIPGSGGLRKVRWGASGRGKRGGARVIYYYAIVKECVLLLLIYTKNEKDDLTRDQLTALRKLVESEFNER